MELRSNAQYNVARNGKTFGPYTAYQLSEMAESGRLFETDFLWTDGMEDWQPAVTFTELITQFQKRAKKSTTPRQTQSDQPAKLNKTSKQTNITEQSFKSATQQKTVKQSGVAHSEQRSNSNQKLKQPKKAAQTEQNSSTPQSNSIEIVKSDALDSKKSSDFEKINFDQLPYAKFKGQ